MQIKKIVLTNFRSIDFLEIDFNNVTAILGANNVGKSSIIKAIDLFFSSSPRVTEDDYFFKDTSKPISISIDFGLLTPAEIMEFGSAVVDEKLSVSRDFSYGEKDSGQYSVIAKVNPDFKAIRAEGNGTRRRALYNDLAKDYENLSSVGTVGEADEAMSKWEVENPDGLQPERIRGFFGAINVANGKLRKKTSFHLIPAVREASEETSSTKNSPVLGLLAEIARQTLENRKELQQFIREAQEKAVSLIDPAAIPELNNIGSQLTNSIQRFYSDAQLHAQWEGDEPLTVNYPKPKIAVENRGMISEVEYVGHGLQRAILFSIVQFLAERRALADQEEVLENKHPEAQSDIVIAVEEPEIYQHPNKQKVIYDAIYQIAEGYNISTGIRIQVIYTTHSEKFTTMTKFEDNRIIRKYLKDGIYRTSCASVGIKKCCHAFASFFDPPKEPMSEEAFGSKLHIFTREVCEGFFAEKVILVEGVGDKALIEAAYLNAKRDNFREGIAVISVVGKANIDRPAYIFRELSIPTYVLFDNDRSGNETNNEKERRKNIIVQKACGVEEVEDFPEGCYPTFAAMEGKLEKYLHLQMGEQYERIMNQVSSSFGISFSDIKKTPSALSSAFFIATEAGIKFPFFEEILNRVDQL